MAEIVPRLPKEIQEEVCSVAIHKAWSIKDTRRRRSALKILFPIVCTEALRTEILQTSLKITDKIERAYALLTLIPLLSGDQQGQTAQNLMQSIQSLDLHPNPVVREYIQATILAILAPYLPKVLKEDAVKLSSLMERPFLNVEVWAVLAPILPEDRGKEILQEALKFARNIEFDAIRAVAIARLLPLLPERDQSIALDEALQATREIEESPRRRDVLTILSPYLIRLSTAKLYPLWNQLLHFLARRTRTALVADLLALRSVIAVLGGTQAVAETAREISEIGDWW